MSLDTYRLSEVAVAISTYADVISGLLGANYGRLLPGVRVRACDRNGRVVPVSGTGEIIRQGRRLVFGYHDNDVGATFDREGFFPTGDRGRLTSPGCLKWLGRLKDTIEVRSTGVAQVEIESCLLTFPGDEDVLVFGVRWDANDGRRAVIIYVSSDAHLDAGDFQPHLMRCPFGYKVPTAVAVFGSGPVPRSGTGQPACIKAIGSFHTLRPGLGRVSMLSREIWDCRDA